MHDILEQVRRAPSVLDVIALADALANETAVTVAEGGAAEAARALVEAADRRADAPTAIAATHALARLPVGIALAPIRDLLDDDGWLAPHVAWALADQPPMPELLDPLVRLVDQGRLGGMLAQRTLARWAPRLPGAVPVATKRRLDLTATPLARARLVETLGLVGGSTRDLTMIALGPEPAEVRAAAVAALGDRPGAGTAALIDIANEDGPTAEVARLALIDQRAGADRGIVGPPVPRTGRLRIAQVHLAGHLDRALAHAGQGSTGGVATLLVQLGDALADDARVESVVTIGRGTSAEALAGLTDPVTRTADSGDEHVVVPAPLARHEDASFSGGWPAVIAAERGIRRILAERPVDLLHLRMADTGSLAAARIARQQGIPIVFTLAPDPHAVIAEMERAGELDRASFGPADSTAALWYRARLVRSLADTARQIALFPRTDLAARLRDLLGIDISAAPGRYHVVPEGIDPKPVRAARRDVAGSRDVALLRGVAEPTDPPVQPATDPGATDLPAVLGELRAAIAALGPDRRGLPLVVSVGRLAEVKGMARLVEAFATDASLRQRANLVIVGGDLGDPSSEEQDQLDRIEAVFVHHPEVADGLVMLGHRPHDDVLRVLAAADAGLGPDIAAGGAYACASRKEEFGLAIVEALATGLPVVAPRAGGPPSYVEDGQTGRLVDTLDRSELAAAIHDALDLAQRPGRAERARSLVADRFSIRAMADSLVPIYGAVLEAAPAASVPAPAGRGPVGTPLLPVLARSVTPSVPSVSATTRAFPTSARPPAPVGR